MHIHHRTCVSAGAVSLLFWGVPGTHSFHGMGLLLMHLQCGSPPSTQPQELCIGWEAQENMSQSTFLAASSKVIIAKMRKLRLGRLHMIP